MLIKTGKVYHVDGIEIDGKKFRSYPCHNFFLNAETGEIILEENGDDYVYDYSLVEGTEDNQLKLRYIGSHVSKTGIFNNEGNDVELNIEKDNQ